jgi:hypothetical protein
VTRPINASPGLIDRLRKAIELDYLGETTASTMRVLMAEVTAQVSEATTAVPEPLAVGRIITVARSRDHRHSHVTVSVPVERHEALRERTAEKVGIWSADLAEQVVDHEDERIGFRNELAAMTAVARRMYDGDVAVKADGEWSWFSDGKPITDAQRDALKLLEEDDG